jgi:hypothetical protein
LVVGKEDSKCVRNETFQESDKKSGKYAAATAYAKFCLGALAKKDTYYA